MLGKMGRPTKEAIVDGEYYTVKKPIRSRASHILIVPKDFVEAVGMGREVKYYLIQYRDMDFIVRPYFDELPLGQGEGI